MSVETSMDTKTEIECKINIDYYRKLVRKYLELHRYKTALFWADKVCTLSKGNHTDVYWLAQSMYLSKQYHRAAHLIKSRNLHQTNLQCCHLAATSLTEAKEYGEAMALILEPSLNNEASKISLINASMMEVNTSNGEIDNVVLQGNNLISSMHFEQGRVYEAMDNRELAAESYKQALLADVHCFEAMDAVIQHQMLSAAEEMDLLNSLPFSAHCPTETDQEFVRLLYESKLNKYRAISVCNEGESAKLMELLDGNLDLMVSEAENYYYHCSYMACWKITQEVIAKDPYHLGCLPVHISCLVELKNANDLFLLAHRLVDIYPESAVSWFAVGCYYYVIRKSDSARRFLGKATSLDKLFGPAWLAYGHSFAADKEHDQAMAAYFKASQLMKGCHLPLLYIGLENGLTNNSLLAEKFFLQAQAIAPNDPFVLHEMGVITFQCGNYQQAKKHFEDALERIKANQKNMLQNKWEPLLNNLGHVYRKLQMYEKAIECHMQAMVLSPENPSTYSAIGFCQVLCGNYSQAATLFHKALSLRRDDTLSTTMLNYVLEQLIEEYQEPVEPETEFASPKPKPYLGKDILDCDYLVQSSDKYKQNIPPLPQLIPLDDEPEAATSNTSFKNPQDPNDSSKLSFEVEMLDTSSQTFDGSSRI